MSYKFEQHFDEESLESYAFGRLAEERAEVLEEHLLICEECRTRLDTTQSYIKAMARGSLWLQKESAKPGLFSQVSGWFRWPVMVWAPATAAVLVILAVSAVNLRRNEPILPPVAVSLMANRAEAEVVQAHHPVILHLDTTGLKLKSSAVQVTLVDANGKKLEESSAAFGQFVDFKIAQPLQPGVYYARILKPGSADSAREFALDVR